MPKARTAAEVIAAEATRGRYEWDDMVAIAHVVANRARAMGVTPDQVVGVRKEFNAYNSLNRPPSATVQRAAKALEGALNGSIPDPTNGALSYAQPGYKTGIPGETLELQVPGGGHKFYSIAPGIGKTFQVNIGGKVVAKVADFSKVSDIAIAALDPVTQAMGSAYGGAPIDVTHDPIAAGMVSGAERAPIPRARPPTAPMGSNIDAIGDMIRALEAQEPDPWGVSRRPISTEPAYEAPAPVRRDIGMQPAEQSPYTYGMTESRPVPRARPNFGTDIDLTRPRYEMGNGQYATELSETIQLSDGRWANRPTIGNRAITGVYDTLQEAERAAQLRSNVIDQARSIGPTARPITTSAIQGSSNPDDTALGTLGAQPDAWDRMREQSLDDYLAGPPAIRSDPVTGPPVNVGADPVMASLGPVARPPSDMSGMIMSPELPSNRAAPKGDFLAMPDVSPYDYTGVPEASFEPTYEPTPLSVSSPVSQAPVPREAPPGPPGIPRPAPNRPMSWGKIAGISGILAKINPILGAAVGGTLAINRMATNAQRTGGDRSGLSGLSRDERERISRREPKGRGEWGSGQGGSGLGGRGDFGFDPANRGGFGNN